MIKPILILASLLAAASPAIAEEMLIIAHRGASAERPEHTLPAYELAIDQGADYIEPDLVATKDLVLVSRHENELSGTTDVATREEFEDRRRDKTIDGQKVAGWFAEDFTLAELRTLRAKERIPSLRPASARYDGLYQVPTLAEIVKLVRAKEAATGRRIGLYPELKHPEFLLQNAGIDMVDLLLQELR
ncbi:MAG TPA: glycerophosphodiester phosphodiesterase family protein, partial [Erythrobacter sp.]|nr:glycerophosphodiester phosphodiesterase family protein [Erythrobacter sp.]